jgi:uncharacterized protein
MKYLVLLAVLVVAYLLWRNARLERGPDKRPPPGSAAPQEMVSCPVCGLHLPQPDAVRGADGRFYCCNEHRLRAGG